MDKLFQISQVGGKTTEISIKALSPIEQVMTKFANDLIKRAQDNLVKKNANASFNLSSSIDPLPIKVMGNEYTLLIEWPTYGKFVDQGVRGAVSGDKAQGSPFKYTTKMPPRKSFEDYITKKPINPGGRRGDRFEAREQLAKFMQVMTYRYGTRRTLFFSDALTTDMQEALVNDVAEALGKTISIQMKL